MNHGRPPRSDGGDPTDVLDAQDVADASDDRPLDELLAALEAELRATEELPVAPAASVWLGEAHAVAADLTRGDVDRAVIHDRVGHVHHLLTSADAVDNDEAADRVSNALAVARVVRDRTREAHDDGDRERS
jgi:hypothetical protein